jgi:hypothetical protein
MSWEILSHDGLVSFFHKTSGEARLFLIFRGIIDGFHEFVGDAELSS